MSGISKIRKRDGRIVDFDISKISEAILNAAKVLGGNNKEMSDKLASDVHDRLIAQFGSTPPPVESIQDVVEAVLIDNGHARTAKEYILYRAERTKNRDMNMRLMKTYQDLTFKSAKDNDIKRENANIDGDTAMGTMLKYGSEGAKQFYEMFVLNDEHAQAHKDGDIHIHDLDFLTLTTTCCQIDIRKLFKNGFSTGHGFLREPNDIQSYAALACIAIQSNQNDQHGGQSIPYFDYGMADGVRKTFKRLYYTNIGKIIDIKYDKENTVDKVKEYAKKIEEEQGLVPCMANDNEYMKAEKAELSKFIPEADIEKAIFFCELTKINLYLHKT